MPTTLVLARDYLQRAATVLQGSDTRSRQLRDIIERTIGLIDETPVAPSFAADNVVDLAAFRERRAGGC